jgi:glycosyltransferase involved in cell wall biosynthesis
MRILHCIPSMGGGGAERQLTHISRGSKENGWDVHVALLYGGPNLDRLRSSGVMIHQLRCYSNYDPGILLRLLSTIRKLEPDIIQTWMPLMDILGGLAATLTDVPFIVSEQASALAYTRDGKNWLRSLIANRAAAIIANSDAGRRYWADKLNHDGAITVLRNIIPFDEINSAPLLAPEAMQVAPDSELIIYAGRYSPQKNLVNLLDGLREVLAQRKKAIAILFGEGPLREDLVAIKEESGCGDRLRIMNFTTDLWSWFKRAQVFVSVSYFEGQPNVVLEAIAGLCPVVVSDIPEHREFLDDESACFVSASSPSAIAQGIIESLSNPENATIRAHTAYNSLSRFAVNTVSQEYIKLYQEILGSHNSGDQKIISRRHHSVH